MQVGMAFMFSTFLLISSLFLSQIPASVTERLGPYGQMYLIPDSEKRPVKSGLCLLYPRQTKAETEK